MDRTVEQAHRFLQLSACFTPIHCEMISIRKSDVPEYLRSSPHFCNAFQESVDDDPAADEITIEVPADCLKLTPRVENESELRALLLTVRFWLVPELIENITGLYLVALEDRENFNKVVLEFQQDFPFLTKLSSALVLGPVPAIMANAVELGLLGLIKHLRYKGAKWDVDRAMKFASIAAKNGHLDILQYAVENGCPIEDATCSMATKGGHLNCLKYAHEHKSYITKPALENAVHSGSLECVKYIVDTQALYIPNIKRMPDIAARAGNLELLRYLLDVGFEATVSASNCAAAYDQLESLKVLQSAGCPASTETSFVAVHCGSLQCVKYLFSIGCGWDEFTLERHNNSNIVNARGVYCQAFPAEKVLSSLLFAAENGCPVTAKTVSLAAELGSVEFLTYLHGRGIALHGDAFRIAVGKQKLDCVRFFLEHGYAGETLDYVAAVRYGCQETVRCLYERKVPWDATVTEAALFRGDVDLLRYLLERGCPVGSDLCAAAAKVNLLDFVECLHEFGYN